jgi:polyhydroxyalkanoate synthase
MTHSNGEEGDAMGENLERLNANMERLDALSKRLVAAFGQKEASDAGLQGPGNDLYMKAGTAYLNEMMANPSKLMEQQVAYWGKTLTHFIEAQQSVNSEDPQSPQEDTHKDRRFSNPMWQTHPYFRFVKQQYQASSEVISAAVADLEGLSPADKKRAEFFSRQIIDLFAPTNYLATNPDALERAVATDGQSLVDGLENLVRDFEEHKGELLPTLADPKAFTVGENLGTTKGSVVFRNRMFELIQYAPTTETVHRTPLLIFPPWINKFYILDLKAQNSLVKWIVDQGYTLFMISWANPDGSYADVSLDTYIEEGYLEAVRVAKEITGEKQVNAVGYCVAGTTLSITLGLMKKRRDTSIKSATFFTTMTDFEDQGEFGVFLSDDFVDAIERAVNEKGVLNSYFMSRTFSYLRSNDLIYTPAVRSYMMGEAPPAFDLLYWNGDSTNLAGAMVVQYLRDLCQGNKLAHDGVDILGETMRLKDVTIPVCAIACETDHIAAWKASYNGFRQMSSQNKTFILSESGHIAGIVNPPSKKKYGHYSNPTMAPDADSWMKEADFNAGSWWPRWEGWLKKRSGAQVPARIPGDSDYEILTSAPGTYVLVRTND